MKTLLLLIATSGRCNSRDQARVQTNMSSVMSTGFSASNLKKRIVSLGDGCTRGKRGRLPDALLRGETLHLFKRSLLPVVSLQRVLAHGRRDQRMLLSKLCLAIKVEETIKSSFSPSLCVPDKAHGFWMCCTRPAYASAPPLLEMFSCALLLLARISEVVKEEERADLDLTWNLSGQTRN